MVYGEFIQKEPVLLAKLLADHLPQHLNTTYLTNSGTEAIEGALKLAKRVTGRAEIIAAKKAYHGNTMGAMSVMGYELRKSAYRPLIPGTRFIRFNNPEDLKNITSQTAAVILETIQGGAGFIVPDKGYLKKVKKRCEDVGALLILDEIQPGIGRTGKLFAFMDHEIAPDILVIGKGLGGGLPVGAFIADQKHMAQLKQAPSLGHITTFGGNPVIAAACRATLDTMLNSNLIAATLKKEKLFRKLLVHPKIKAIRGKGLMLALIMEDTKTAQTLVKKCLEEGVLLFFLLFEPKAVRISPPLTISEKQIKKACKTLIKVLNQTEC
jgi:acetylornithine/succinyldiaminopimelate/putrescine aminotransferase